MRVPTWIYVIICVGILFAAVQIYKEVVARGQLIVTVLEVGKGYATLIKSPENRTLLIDTGPDASILRAIGETLPMWQRSIDAIILTSDKKAFVGGLNDLKSRYKVAQTLNSSYSYIFDGISIEILGPGLATISYDTFSLIISSSTPKGVYKSD